ncbi:cytochrome c-type biogenesis protein [Melghiribacillus thermohalophilus]|uniref:Cytochrome c-type biogenesis protein n=1 Tax=Melghiribacillus thermohalophilus TaxID=1324956 RepID=A0A4R3NDH6_9BACI|nr:cytochrome c biogenesis protein CcdA [Melghiribacillus thermohalophilus]TCT26665.1 cytochrome c-type biogenesis protein [Melghiribacillus thermohalophilus]
MEGVNIFIAFGAGFLSFISPCVLPLYPVFLSYVTGMSVTELKADHAMLRKRSLLHTLFFLVGFSAIFIMLGFATYSIGEFLLSYRDYIRQIGAILMVFFGFVMIGFFNFDFLMKERRITFKNRPSGYFGSFLIGMAFSMSWTPCTGPILAAVISLAATDPDTGIILMSAYSLGFSVPFFILSFFIGKLDWIKRNSEKLVRIGGYVMIGLGIALFFDWMYKITAYLSSLFGFTGF